MFIEKEIQVRISSPKLKPLKVKTKAGSFSSDLADHEDHFLGLNRKFKLEKNAKFLAKKVDFS